ncbi:MAG: imidazolonepropionase [candidate division KSB1 bacterium]|nr:imidazolonepropionase [candidate division KSB1 bacterium]
MQETRPIADGAVAICGGRIAAVGPEAQIAAAFTAEHLFDAGGGLVTPGLIDPHTHSVYAGSREDEWQRRLAGESYLEILRSGGGIQATVRAVRAADEASLRQAAERRLRQMLAHGTTTVEIKTGYGLDAENELKMLKVIDKLGKNGPLDIVGTFLGAHVVPKNISRQAYLDWLTGDALEETRPYARFFDVFCEQEAFSAQETERLLRAAANAGFRLKAHVGQFHSLGGAHIAAELGAVSIDHCEHLSDAEIKAMAAAGTIAVLLPGASFFLGREQYANARRLIEAGVPVALATDFNPGSCPCFSMQMILALACLKLQMSAAEALTASTLNAAYAIDLGDRLGSLEPGKQADLAIWQVERLELLPYHFGCNLLYAVVKNGRIILGPDFFKEDL